MKPVNPTTGSVDWSKVPVAKDEDFKYEIVGNITNSVAVLTEYVGNNPYVKMPKELGGEKVIKITDSMNWNKVKAIMLSNSCKPEDSGVLIKDWWHGVWHTQRCIGYGPYVTEVVLPDSWTFFGFYNGADNEYGMRNLEKVNFPKSLTEIQMGAFAFTKLKSVTIPERIVFIDVSAFQDCASLTTINFPKKFSSGCTVEKNAFLNCTALKSVSIPSGMKFGDGVFENCTSLTKVSLPSSLDSISRYMFKDCKSLPDIKLPSGLKRIGARAFENCSSLKKINIPDSVTYIESDAFKGIPGITVTYKGMTFNEKNVSKLYNVDLSKV